MSGSRRDPTDLFSKVCIIVLGRVPDPGEQKDDRHSFIRLWTFSPLKVTVAEGRDPGSTLTLDFWVDVGTRGSDLSQALVMAKLILEDVLASVADPQRRKVLVICSGKHFLNDEVVTAVQRALRGQADRWC